MAAIAVSYARSASSPRPSAASTMLSIAAAEAVSPRSPWASAACAQRALVAKS